MLGDSDGKVREEKKWRQHFFLVHSYNGNMIFDVWIPLIKKGVRKEHIKEWTVSTSMVVFFFNFIAKGLKIPKLPDLGEKGMHHTAGQEP